MTANLIVNGGADADVGSTTGDPVPATGWTATGMATPEQYGTAGYPEATDPGPADRGANLFIGGADGADASLTQTINLGAYSAAISGSHVSFTLSGYLGGYSSQDDQATLTAVFKDVGGTVLATATLGPVLASDRGGVTGLLFRTRMGNVPVNATSVVVTLTMTRLEGTANDGYADSLSLVLSGI